MKGAAVVSWAAQAAHLHSAGHRSLGCVARPRLGPHQRRSASGLTRCSAATDVDYGITRRVFDGASLMISSSLTPELGGLDGLVRRIGPVTAGPLSSPSRYLRPQMLSYTLDGKAQRWDMALSLSSVGAALRHKELDALILVRQFRPAVYASAAHAAAAAGAPPPQLSVGVTYELPAGVLDKPGLSPEAVCRAEISEECGFEVPPGALTPLASTLSAIGISGSSHALFTGEVSASQRASRGGGVPGSAGEAGELIEVLALPLDSALRFVGDNDRPKSAGLVVAILWWLLQRPPR